jgi:hypothetical protein
MVRRFLFLGSAVLALVCTVGLPGQVNAHHRRAAAHGSYRQSSYPSYDGNHYRPNSGGTNDGQFESNPRVRQFNRGFGGSFRRSFGGRGGFGSAEPRFYVGL